MDLLPLRRPLRARFPAIVVALAFSLWAFIEVAEEVVEGDSAAFDRAILLALHAPGGAMIGPGPAWLTPLARDVTALGGIPVLGLLVAFVAVFLLLAGRRWHALVVPLAPARGVLASSGFRATFLPPRPDDPRQTIRTPVDPEVHFSPESLFEPVLNLRFFSAVPNYLTGAGMLGTFLGLVAGIDLAQDVLHPPHGGQPSAGFGARQLVGALCREAALRLLLRQAARGRGCLGHAGPPPL